MIIDKHGCIALIYCVVFFCNNSPNQSDDTFKESDWLTQIKNYEEDYGGQQFCRRDEWIMN